MQARRLDAITMLLGDAGSIEMAANRMRSDFARVSLNLLQQTAVRKAQKYDVWVGVDPRHLASLASALGAPPNQGLAVLSNFRAISVGLYLRDQIRIHGVQRRTQSHPCSGVRGFAAGMACADYDNVVLLIEHRYFPMQNVEKMRPRISSVTTSPVSSSNADNA